MAEPTYIRQLVLTLACLVVLVHPVAALDLPDIAADAEHYRQRIASAHAPDESVASYLRAAKQAAETRRWSRAIKAFESLLARSPNDPETWLRLARAWRGQDPNAAELSAAAYNAYLDAQRAGLPDQGAASEALLLIAQQQERLKRRELAIRIWAEVGRIVSDPQLAQKLEEQPTGAAESKSSRIIRHRRSTPIRRRRIGVRPSRRV